MEFPNDKIKLESSAGENKENPADVATTLE
jgi:hypothetical protein